MDATESMDAQQLVTFTTGKRKTPKLERYDPKRVNLPPVAKKLAKLPDKARGTYKRAATGKAKAIGAIKAFCSECMGYDDYVKGVRECTDPACPLFLYRPFQRRRTVGD